MSKTVRRYKFEGIKKLKSRRLLYRIFSAQTTHIDFQMQDFFLRWLFLAYKSLSRLDIFFSPKKEQNYHKNFLRLIDFIRMSKRTNPVYINVRGLPYDPEFMKKLSTSQAVQKRSVHFLWNLSRWPPKTFLAFPHYDIFDFTAIYAAVAPDFMKLPYMVNMRSLTIERGSLVDPS